MTHQSNAPRLHRLISRAVLCSFMLAGSFHLSAAQDTASRPSLQDKLVTLTDSAVEKYKIPATSVLVIEAGKLAARYTTGGRVSGEGIKATDNDLLHIGSCGKSITVATILRLVDKGRLDLDAPISATLPQALIERTHPQLRSATLLQLLNHTSGMPELDVEDAKSKPDSKLFRDVANAEVRLAMQTVVPALIGAPANPPGSRFVYSNYAYIVASIVAMHATSKEWTTLVKEEVFAPLNMKSAGFGPPRSTPRPNASQPWGHDERKLLGHRRLEPKAPDRPDAELPIAFIPAGLMHMSMDNWGSFLTMLLNGFNRTSTYLSAKSFERFFTPAVLGERNTPYALGIGVLRDQAGRIRVLAHTGSNGFWRADFRIFPVENRIYMMAANAGFEEVDSAFADIRSALNTALNPK